MFDNTKVRVGVRQYQQQQQQRFVSLDVMQAKEHGASTLLAFTMTTTYLTIRMNNNDNLDAQPKKRNPKISLFLFIVLISPRVQSFIPFHWVPVHYGKISIAHL